MRSLLCVVAFACLTSLAQAHFIWLEPIKNDDGSTTIQVYFGEDAYPDDPAYLGRLKAMNLQHVSGKDAPQSLDLKLTEEALTASVPEEQGRSLYIASHDLGVFDRGDSVFRLKYYAKTGPSITSSTWQQAETSDDLRLDVVPAFDNGTVTVTVRFDGKPVGGAQVIASGAGMSDFDGETDPQGQASFEMADAGLYSIRARHIENAAGELDGKSYPETRHYSTVAVSLPAPLPEVAADVLATLEEPVTSFGAALIEDHLYLYGGHTGGAHSYSTAEQADQLTRLNLKTREWETLASGPHLQGLALVAHDGRLYRIGGFTAKNAEGEEHDLWSQDSVAVFDPAAKRWSNLPPLPEPRSSFDAAVVGEAVYVVGGWSMQGDEENEWHETAWKLDLSGSQPQWQPLPSPPFQRRALAVAAYDGKLYAIGGMDAEGGPSRAVDVFDPASGKWSSGPELPGEGRMAGFGASAFATGDRLYITTIDGVLQRMSRDGSQWEIIGKTPTARFFHRMLPLDNSHLLVVGGANMGIGKFEEVEVLSVTP
jgi:N-acetylneuraminic acid mutarotase/uncharacterized GH25 family protein